MEILSRKRAAEAGDFSERTLDRLHVEGKGPPRVQLSERRVGYEVKAFQRWLASRTFTSRAAALAAGATTAAPSQHTRKGRRKP